MKVTQITITPSVAEALLEKNIANFRRPSKSKVERYAGEMKRGCWQSNGDTIKLDDNGVLLDGQHRLLAVVRSGVTIPGILIEGISPESVSTIDRGRPRTIPQWLAYKGIVNASTVATTARLCVLYEKGLWSDQAGYSTCNILDSEIMDYVDTYQEGIIAACRKVSGTPKTFGVSSTAAVAFLGCGKRDINQSETAVWFLDRLTKGDNLSELDPVYHLRNKFLKQTPQSKMTPFMIRMSVTLAWNKTIRGEPSSGYQMAVKMTGPSKTILPNEIEQVTDII